MASPFDTIPQLQYDVRAAQKAGLTEADIAQYASKRRNYDYQTARESGLTDADLIRHNIANVSESGSGGAFLEEAASAVAPALAMGAAAPLGWGAGVAGAAALGLTGPVGVGLAAIGALGAMMTAGGVATAGVDKLKEELDIGGGQYVPSAQMGAVAGETFGFVASLGLPAVARGVAYKLAGTPVGKAFGLKPLGASVAKAGDDLFLPAGVKPVDLGSSVLFANAAGNTKLGRAVVNLETALSKSRAGKLTAPGKSFLTNTATAGYMSAGAAGAEAIDPGNVPLRIGAEVIAGVVNPASLINLVGSRVSSLLKKGFQKFKPGGTTQEETRIVGALQKMVDDIAKEGGTVNLKQTIAELKDTLPNFPLGKVPKFNSAEKTNDDFMQVLGATLMSLKGGQSDALQKSVIAQSIQASKDVGAILDQLSLIETPEMMAVVSELLETNYKNLMEASLNLHVLKATERATMVANRTQDRRKSIEGTKDGETVFTPGGELIGDKTSAGKVMIDTLFQAAEHGRGIERSLWGKVNPKLEVNISNILKFWDKETLPSVGGSDAAKGQYIPYLNNWIKEQREISMAELNEVRAIDRAPLEKQLANVKGYVPKDLAPNEVKIWKEENDISGQIRLLEQQIEALKPYTLATLPNELVTSTVGQAQKFRSSMLNNSRVKAPTEAGAPQSGYYSKMGEKALDDMSDAGTGLVGEDRISFINARAFSKAFNDEFSRGFGAELIKPTASGADRMSPETLANTLIHSAGNQTAARLRELDSALDFIIKQTPDPIQQRRFQALKKYDYRGATEIILRDLLSNKVIDAQTGELKLPVLARELQKYKDVFALPGMKMVERDLRNAKTAQITLNKMRNDIKTTGYNPTAEGLVARGKTPSRGQMTEEVLGQSAKNLDAIRVLVNNRENPIADIVTIRNSNNPADGMTGLANVAKKAKGLAGGTWEPPKPGDPLPPAPQRGIAGSRLTSISGDPVKGLQEVVVNAAVESSRNADGTIDFTKFQTFLLEPMTGRGSSSLGDVLKRNKIINDDELNALVTLSDYGQRTQRILKNIDNPELIIQDLLLSGSIFAQAAGRAVGSTTFTNTMRWFYNKLPFNFRQSGITEANIGANLAGKYLDILPMAAQQRLLTTAFQDPEYMAALLERIKQPKDVREFHLVQRPILESILGLELYREISEKIKRNDFFDEEVTEEVVPVAMAPAPQPSAPLVDTTVAPRRMAPTPPPPAQGPPPPASQGIASLPAAPATNRAAYAAMFPYDTASEIIRVQEGVA